MPLAVAAIAAVAGVACNGDEVGPSEVAVATVEVAPPTATVVLGTTVTLTASVLDADGHALTDRKVIWASADSNFATVSPSGVVTGRYVGWVPIAANVEGKAGIAQIQVVPVPVVAVRVSPASRDLTVGQTAQLTAEPLDAQGAVLSNRSVTWSSNRPNVASVNGNGVVAAVSVSPSSATLIVGQTAELEAQPRDASGQPLTGRPVTWSSNHPEIATVTSTGVVAAVSPGTATITASSEGRNGTATIVVNAPAVNRVEVTPAATTVDVGAPPFRLTATVYDSRGNVIPGAQVAWASSDTRIATVDNTGRVRGVAPGSVIVTATSGDKAGTALVTVKK